MNTRAILATAFAISSAAGGAALAETRTYDFEGFDAVSVAAGVNADITVGDDFSVVAEGSEKALERLEIRFRDRQLKIGRRTKGMNWKRDSDQVTVRISMPSLIALSGSSGAEVDAQGVDANGFSVDGSSGAELSVSGVCEGLVADVSSGARIRAEDLQCKTANADASSGGSMKIFANDSLIGDASSGGRISVSGSPQRVVQGTSSGGSISTN